MVRQRLIYDDEYDRLLTLQGGGCAICGAFPVQKSLAVDHDHKTGRVRGLLCMSCNTGLGHFYDNVGLLEMAIDYLESESLEDLTVTETYTERRAEWEEMVGSSQS